MKWLIRLFAIIGLGTVAIIAGIFFLASQFRAINKAPVVPPHTVLTYDLQGDLSDHMDEGYFLSALWPHEFTLHHFIETLDHASRDPHIEGILVRLDHSALGIAKIQELHTALRRFRSTGKFAIAHCDTFGEILNGTSTYFLAAAFDEIALQPLGSLNIVGLSTELPFGRKLLEELGIDPRFDRREEYKSIIETYTHSQISPENRASLQGLLNNLLKQIMDTISQEREINPQELKQIIDRAPYYKAEEAKQLGLIDHIFYLDECEEYALKKAGKEAKFMALSTYRQAKPEQHPTENAENTAIIAVISGNGTIARVPHYNDLPFMQADIMDSNAIGQAFEEALEDKPRAIVFRINSPGGSPVASETIRRYIVKAKKQGVPVVVSMGDYAASGGYWIASSATKIIAAPGTITGSIGVAGGKMVFSRLWDKLGVSWSTIKAGNNADMNSINQDFTPEQWQKHQEWLDYIYESFLKCVAEGRHLTLDQVRQRAKGYVWTGEQAMAHGLVDGLGGVQEAIKVARDEAKLNPEETISLIAYPRKKSLLQQIKHKMEREGLLGAIRSTAQVLKQIKTAITAIHTDFNHQALMMQPHTRIQ
jgi:protease-4